MKIRISILCFLISGFMIGQNPEIKAELPTIIPPSPTVAALMKFEEVPVSNYNGIPDITIPLVNMPTISKNINLSIALKYHPSGIKADDRASDVGLGWSLFAGGTISRTVKGLPDEELVLESSSGGKAKVGLYQTSVANHVNHYYQHGSNFLQFIENQPYQANEYAWGIVESNKYDTEHDLWQFNFMGKSGRFYIQKNLQTNVLEIKPLDDYRVTIINHYQTINGKEFIPTGFTIFDENGYQYVFDIIEKTTNTAAAKEVRIYGDSDSISSGKEFNSSFHLSKIYDNNNNLLLEFNFNTNTIIESTRSFAYTRNEYDQVGYDFMKTRDCFKEFKPLMKFVFSTSVVNVKKIQSVTITNVGKVDFEYTQGRFDTNLINPNNAAFLTALIVKDKDNLVTKKYTFEYDYSTVLDKRLILKKINQKPLNNALVADQVHQFYYQTNPTNGDVIAKDYWGYFNLNPTYKNVDINLTGECTPSFSTTDILQKIKYPTNGCAIFDFEANRYSFQGNIAMSDFTDNPDNFTYTGSEEFYFTENQNLKVITASSLARKGIFKPCISASEEPVVTFQLLKKVNGAWTVALSLNCDTNPDCGIEYMLEPLTEYAIRRNVLNVDYNLTDSVNVLLYNKNATPNYHYGGGNRIRSIAYFDKDVDQNYFKNTALASQITPTQQTNYDYSLFTDTSKSSGSLVFPKPLFKYTGKTRFMTGCEIPPNLPTFMPKSPVEAYYTTYTNFNNLVSLKTQGADVGYKNVIVEQLGKGSTRYTYTSPIDYPEEISNYNTSPPFLPTKDLDYKRGLLLSEITQSQNNTKLKEVSHEYTFDEFEVKYGFRRFKPSGMCFEGSFFTSYTSYLTYYPDYVGKISYVNGGYNVFSSFNLCGYPVNYSQSIDLVSAYGWAKLNTKTTKEYFYPNGSSTPNIVQTNESFTYNPTNKQIASHSVTTSLGQNNTTNYYYHTGNSIYSQNRIAEIERIETFKAGQLVSENKINYHNAWTNNVAFLPQTIQTKKGTNAPEIKVRYTNYDEFGNARELQQEDGMYITYLWGYNKTQPIAKIENARYADVQQYEANLQTLSNGTDENALLLALNTLRSNFPNAMVTTYTHKPLIGVSTVTSPVGEKVTYIYDEFNRLKQVIDHNGNILNENQYNYRAQ